MSNQPPIPPVEHFAGFVRGLVHAVVTRGLWWGLPPAIVNLIVNRTREIKFSFARLAARIQAGTFVPRRVTHRRKPLAPRKPPGRRPFGWLCPLVPEAAGYGSALQNLLAEPEAVAMIQAAPAEMARLFRPLCWMLRVRPPAILAPPKREAPPEAAPPTATRAPRPPKSPPPRSRPPGPPPARPARRRRGRLHPAPPHPAPPHPV